MSHFRYKKWLDEYRDGKLTGPIRLQVKNHLRTCRKCQERLDLINWAEKIVQLADVSQETPPVSPWFSQKVIHRIRQVQSESATLWIPVYRLAQKTIPLMLLLAALMGGLTYYEWSSLSAVGTDNPLVTSFSDPSDRWGEQLIAGGNTAPFLYDQEENPGEQPVPITPAREGKKQ